MSRESGRWLWALALMAGSVCAPEGAAAAQPPHAFEHVRTTNVLVRHALETSAAASPTMRALLAEIDDSDVIIHVVVEPISGGLMGSLNFARETGGFRYLRITLRPGLSRLELASFLAHELQHANEIAHAPQVHDQASMKTFYDTVGYPVGDHFHDTHAARDVGQQVRQEIANYAAHPELR